MRKHCLDQRERLPVFRDESYELIGKILDNQQDIIVLGSAISALGHLDNPNAIPLIQRYERHPNQDVRFAVAFALSCFPNHQQAISALMRLTTDCSFKVRDWAVFGFGVLGDVDSPEIRGILLRCLNDPNEDVREEAAVGLGKRHNQRLIPSLWTMLDNPEFTCRVADAATALLGLDEPPPEWAAVDYKTALTSNSISRRNQPRPSLESLPNRILKQQKARVVP